MEAVSESDSRYRPYRVLRTAAFVCLERAEGDDRGSHDFALASIVLTAMVVEGYLNHLGRDLVAANEFNRFQRQRPKTKLERICGLLASAPDIGAAPYQDFDQIFKFRNDVAHPKTSEGAEPSWYAQCRPETARSYYNSATAMIEDLHRRAGHHRGPFQIERVSPARFEGED